MRDEAIYNIELKKNNTMESLKARYKIMDCHETLRVSRNDEVENTMTREQTK